MSAHPHGSRERYEESPDGCCDGCRLMMILHERHDRPMRVRTVPVRSTKRDAEPFAKLLRILLRDGYTIREIAQRSGLTREAVNNIALGITTWVYPATAACIEALVKSLPSHGSVSA